MISELFAVWCDLFNKISARGAKLVACLCDHTETLRCGATVCVQRKPLCVHFDVRKIASNVLFYTKDLQMCTYCQDSRHVQYFIIHCQWSAVAQLVECRTRNRESPGSNPRCYRFEVWVFSFTSRRLSRLSCINEYLAIDSGGNVSE